MIDQRSVDPVSEGAAYQRLLLGQLGDDDPAHVQAETPGQLRRLAARAGDRLRVAPSPGEWSVLECIGHILDAEMIATVRYRWILAQDRPDIVPYDQALWAERLRHAEADPETMLATLEALRAANLELWHRSTPAERERIGLHRERGEESYDLTFRLVAGHDRLHAAQAREAMEAARESVPATS